MPVQRFPGLPNTRVYTRAGVVLHDGIVYGDPEYGGCDHMVRELRKAIGRQAFKTFDWGQPIVLSAAYGHLTIRSPEWAVFFYLYALDAPIIPTAPAAGN